MTQYAEYDDVLEGKCPLGGNTLGGAQVHRATRHDLVSGSNAQLRAVAEVHASADGHERSVRDFVAVRDEVMMADRYDVRAG
ncbi:hypothetical protein [Klenkia marina]|uniref:hypothetical protein n=1 Tax=Klenkia marina TaxID=1960309 RepID=UPI000B80DD33|nr:hypothetical protein [Klenkia marina]